MNSPEEFAQVYVNENNLPIKFILIISTQIKKQIFDYLDQMLTNFTELYEAKLNDKINSEINPRKISESILFIFIIEPLINLLY